MTGELLITTEDETGQLIGEGGRTGPAGGAYLTPASGLELHFDRVTGRMSRLTADLDALGPEAGASTDGDGELTMRSILFRLFGARGVPGPDRSARDGPTGRLPPPEPELAGAFSRLARFDAARATSPVTATSPLWSAEAAALALRAGLRDRARSEARSAVAGLAGLLAGVPCPAQLVGPAVVVAGLAQADDPESAGAVRRGAAREFGGSLAEWAERYGPPTGESADGGVHGLYGAGAVAGEGWGSLDLTQLPAGLFLPGLTPAADLLVCTDGQDVLTVKVRLAPDASDDALRCCRARLVDSAARQVVATAPLTREGSLATACLPAPAGGRAPGTGGDLWIEIVTEEDRPVRGQTVRDIHQALRWADSALRARRHPVGLALRLSSGGWDATAAAGWQACRRCWESAGDGERARQAAAYAATPPGAQTGDPEFLAEALGR